MAKLGYVRLSPLCPVSELGCVGLCGAVCVCGLNGHIYILGCAIAQPSVCHLFSWDGFQDVSGLCSLHSGGDEVWGTYCCLQNSWQTPRRVNHLSPLSL